LDKKNIAIKNDAPLEINDLKLSGVSGKISIVGEQGWIDFKDAGNCTGLGTYLDPFVIQDLIIDGHGSGSGIKINLSRNYYFRIENCTIFNCSIGIELISTDNGTLYQNDCSFNSYGIYLHFPHPFTPEEYGCFNNTITENMANNNTYGIRLGWATIGYIINNTANNNNMGILHEGYPEIISENTVNNNHIGISLWHPGYNTEISRNIAFDNRDCGIEIQANGFNLTGNFMVGSGIAMSYHSIEMMSTIHIDTTNFVNNKPIYYLINKTYISPQNLEDAGQIFLINCTNILVKDIDVSNSSYGINIYDSNNITVLNAVSSNNIYGVYLQNTNTSFIINNTLKYNTRGIFVGGSNNTVEGNYIYSDLMTMEGITFYIWGDNNKIINNKIIGCQWGILFRISSYNLIYGNIIKDNEYGIVVMGGSEHNLFYENFFIGNSIVHTDGGSTTNKWNNTEIGNYWDNYTGIDANDDGIGDTPHNITQSPLRQDYLPIVISHAPEITVISPEPNEIFNLTSPSFNVIFESYHLESKWYTVNNGKEYIIMDNVTINQLEWESQWDGLVIVSFYALDKIGNAGFAEINIIKDTEDPIITVASPTPGSEFGNNAPSFSVIILDKHLDTMWYTLDGGLHNYSFTHNGTINQAAWDTILGGVVNIRFYAIDKVGNIAYRDVPIIKQQQQQVLIPGYNTTILMGIMLLSCAILIKIRNKELDVEKL